MSRKIILAIAAIATIGISAFASTDASARAGGGHISGGHSSFSRTSLHSGNVSNRQVRTLRTNVFRPNRVNLVRNPRLPHPPHLHHHHHNHFAWWSWCRHHHHHRCGSYPVIGGVYSEAPVVVSDAARYVAPVAATCTDCDYFLNDAPGCYMAKRKFSTPQGDELRCVKICDEATDVK